MIQVNIFGFPCYSTQTIVIFNITFHHFYMLNRLFLTQLSILSDDNAQISWINYHLCEFNGYIALGRN